MHAFVTSKNVKWCHLIWPTLYMIKSLSRYSWICISLSSIELSVSMTLAKTLDHYNISGKFINKSVSICSLWVSTVYALEMPLLFVFIARHVTNVAKRCDNQSKYILYWRTNDLSFETSHFGKFRMAISPQQVILCTSCLVLLGFSESADREALFSVRSNPRWRPWDWS